MLVSHSHKFIFVKTKKTAGTSIQSFLAPYCKNGVVEERFGSHRGSNRIIDLIGERTWNSYLKICPVRNPWDLMVSWYLWERRELSTYRKIQRVLQGKDVDCLARKVSFQDYMIHKEGISKVNINKHKILVDGQLPDYFYVRYEYLMDDMSALCGRLNIAFEPSEFPHLKKGSRSGRSYQEFYNERTKQIVQEAYKEEIGRFAYKF